MKPYLDHRMESIVFASSEAYIRFYGTCTVQFQTRQGRISMDEHQSILVNFVEESRATMAQIESALMDLPILRNEQRIHDNLEEIWHGFHSIKGSSGFLNLPAIQNVSQTMESVFKHMAHDLTLVARIPIDALLNVCEVFYKALDAIQINLNDNDLDFEFQESLIPLNQFFSSTLPVAEMTTAPIDSMDETIKLDPVMFREFLSEAHGTLERAEQTLLEISKLHEGENPSDLIYAAFRLLHTIKGNSAMLKIEPMSQLAHHAESLLKKMQEHKVPIQKNIPLLLKSMDVFWEALEDLETKKTLDVHAFEAMTQKLNAAMHNTGVVSTNMEGDLPLGTILAHLGYVDPEEIEIALKRQRSNIGELLMEMGAVSQAELEHALQCQEDLRKQQKQSAGSAKQEQNVLRINLEKVEKLVDLVGELVISESMVFQHPTIHNHGDGQFESLCQQHRNYIRQLQDSALSMRMLPIAPLFNKLQRLVLETSQKLGKQAELVTIGKAVEMDKTVLDLIADPLLHIIRNSLDHGIESAEARLAAQKSSKGTISLEARHVGSEVWFIVQDDGRGLDREKIRKKALQQNLIEEQGVYSDPEIWALIMRPGFSTADNVTDISGRGVGMDVVQKNIDQLKGNILIDSMPGKGTTFTLRIPLTLALIDGMITRVGDARYIIPIDSIREIIQPGEVDCSELLNKGEILNLRGMPVKVVRLHLLAGTEPRHSRLHSGTMIILESDREQIALFLDEVLGQQQFTVKALPRVFQQVPWLMGCTIMGDGGISLILDCRKLIHATASTGTSSI
ncbi:MAG: chemotaxis protein CheA [SAR324 cluster bacterium]|nr:chemotaxis protein CheA [SAR324 cluster bacterium]